ncbi:hypothetical protein F5B21DRAFT_500116 [Xylaria acuta]|nr:hypothetical protein F5B21DRAFT_500116 [Xylaria acuta]
MRSASLLRATPIRSQPCRSPVLAGSVSVSVSGRNHMSTTSSLRSSNEPTRPTPTLATSPAKTQQNSYTPYNWSNPAYRTRGVADNIAGIDVLKPNSSSYDLAFGGQKGKEQETDGQELVEFASDLLLNLTDIAPNKQAREALPAPRTYLRMVPRTGRTVYVRNNVDVARSFKLLAVQVSQNLLRRDFQLQRFHERAGKKRKRLLSERWRKRFNRGFKATVSRVRELTAQGW